MFPSPYLHPEKEPHHTQTLQSGLAWQAAQQSPCASQKAFSRPRNTKMVVQHNRQLYRRCLEDRGVMHEWVDHQHSLAGVMMTGEVGCSCKWSFSVLASPWLCIQICGECCAPRDVLTCPAAWQVETAWASAWQYIMYSVCHSCRLWSLS